MISHVLPDVLEYDLSIVFCGTAASTASADIEAYYANPSNSFWRTLAEIGLTSRRLKPHEYRTVLQYRIGLTDMIKDDAGLDSAIRKPTESDRVELKVKIEKFNPRVLAFTSKTAGRAYLRGIPIYGMQSEGIGSTKIFVLPSTSQMARWRWELSYWVDLATYVKATGASDK